MEQAEAATARPAAAVRTRDVGPGMEVLFRGPVARVRCGRSVDLPSAGIGRQLRGMRDAAHARPFLVSQTRSSALPNRHETGQAPARSSAAPSGAVGHLRRDDGSMRWGNPTHWLWHRSIDERRFMRRHGLRRWGSLRSPQPMRPHSSAASTAAAKAATSKRFPAGSSPRRTITTFRDGTTTTTCPRLPSAANASAGTPGERCSSHNVAP